MGSEIHKIQIFGQRCSGTNFLEKLLVANFKDLKIVNYYGFKHIWNAELTNSIQNDDDIKIIIIVRDPYDWLRSVHREPHHCAQLLGLSFHDFVKSPWKAYHSADWNNYSRSIRMKTISDEKLIEEFDDVIDCRNAKMSLFKSIQSGSEDCLIIRYEDLRDNTELTLQNIQNHLGVTRTNKFTQVYSYKETGKNFKRKVYIRLSNSMLEYVNSRINWVNEESFEYYKKNKIPGDLIDYHRMQFLIKQWYYEKFGK